MDNSRQKTSHFCACVCVSHSTSIMTTSTERRRSSCAAGTTVRGSRSPSKLSTCWWFTCADTQGRNHTSARWVTDGLGAPTGGDTHSLNTGNTHTHKMSVKHTCTHTHPWDGWIEDFFLLLLITDYMNALILQQLLHQTSGRIKGAVQPPKKPLHFWRIF